MAFKGTVSRDFWYFFCWSKNSTWAHMKRQKRFHEITVAIIYNYEKIFLFVQKNSKSESVLYYTTYVKPPKWANLIWAGQREETFFEFLFSLSFFQPMKTFPPNPQPWKRFFKPKGLTTLLWRRHEKLIVMILMFSFCCVKLHFSVFSHIKMFQTCSHTTWANVVPYSHL